MVKLKYGWVRFATISTSLGTFVFSDSFSNLSALGFLALVTPRIVKLTMISIILTAIFHVDSDDNKNKVDLCQRAGLQNLTVP